MRTRSLRAIGAATLSSVFLFALVVNIILAAAASSRHFSPTCGGSSAAAAPGTGSDTGGTGGTTRGGGNGGGAGGGGALGEIVRSLTPPDHALLAALRGNIRLLDERAECKEKSCFCNTADKKCNSTCGATKAGTTCNCNDATDTCNQELNGECVGTCQAPAPAGAMWACLVTIALLSIRRNVA